ncbi:MAG: co-chaperone GroES [Candidatus Eremiobacteraeota bacterium]|nr:co-chaperone GroES [Candidatus Eremiobacteraeota bacterium]
MPVKTEQKVKPLGDRVIVEPMEQEEKSVGGVYIPDTAKEKPQRGRIMAVGTGRVLENGTRVPLELKEGQHVLYGKYSGTEVKVDGKEYLIVRESDVLAVLE